MVNALARSCRSVRIGPVLWTLPTGNATTTVRPEPPPRFLWWKDAVAPSMDLSSHSRELPRWPAKHAMRSMSAGPATVAPASAMVTFHSSPIAFQYSSSWSSKWLSAPRTV